MTITGQSALPREDIDRMVRDAEQYAEEDRKGREAAEVRNTADNLLYQTEKLVRDNGDKISAEHKARLEEVQGTVRTALEGDDSDAIKNATDELMRVSQEIGQALYTAGAAEQAGQATTDSATGAADDDIVDAEVVDEDDRDDQGVA